jgi:hypothetical protein
MFRQDLAAIDVELYPPGRIVLSTLAGNQKYARGAYRW